MRFPHDASSAAGTLAVKLNAASTVRAQWTFLAVKHAVTTVLCPHLLAMCFSAIGFAVVTPAMAHAADAPSSRSSTDQREKHVTIVTRDGKRIIEANGLPDHKTGEFPNHGNPNSIREQHYRFEMPLNPHAAEKPRTLTFHLFGVAINGVVFDPGTAEIWVPGRTVVSRPGPNTRLFPGQELDHAWNYEGMGKMELGVDSSHAHVQPNGAYHYHGLPTALIDRLRKEQGTGKMLLIGYAADGFPIYSEFGHEKASDASSPLKKLRSSYQLKKDQRPTGDEGPGGTYDGTFVQDYEFIAGSGDLDQCNGREGVTPEYPTGTFYYVLTDAFPFVPRYFHGSPDPSFVKQHPRPGLLRGGPPPRP